ncbi:MAG: hypothetical protein ACTSUK_07330 [Promethearchaeota archaeon]
MIQQQEGMAIQAFSEAAKESGNVLNCRGKSIVDNILESLEKIDLSFDETGMHSSPMLIVSPEIAEKLKKLPANPETQAKIDEISVN